MRFRLKDRELQKKLDEISKSDFSDALEVCSAAVASALKRGKPTTIWFGVQPQLSLEITPDMLEEVEPPEGVLMRVECRDGRKACAKYRLFIEGGSWCDVNGGAWPEAYSQSVARFRSWDEEDKA